MKTTTSTYNASFTAASMLFNETLVVVRMLLEENSPSTKKRLKEDAQYLKIQASSSRERVTNELSKRFDTMPRSFWENFMTHMEGVGRFVIGLTADVKILDSPELEEYVRSYRDRYLRNL